MQRVELEGEQVARDLAVLCAGARGLAFYYEVCGDVFELHGGVCFVLLLLLTFGLVGGGDGWEVWWWRGGWRWEWVGGGGCEGGTESKGGEERKAGWW